MFGAHVGELRVYMVPMKDEKTIIGRQVIWRRRGTQPDKWMQFTESLNVTEGYYRLEIEAEGGDGFAGDIAIDEVLMSLGGCENRQDMCDFESSTCRWNVEPSQKGRFYWQRKNALENGPERDHTTLSKAGYYLEASAERDAAVEEITNFVSPQYGNRWGPHCLTFWYYRPGLSTGKISVNFRRHKQDSLQWSATQDVGKFWHYGQVNVNLRYTFQLVFKAEKGPNNAHRMAIDDIIIKNSTCDNSATCNFNNDYCGYFLNETSDFAWLLGTGRVVNTQLIDSTPDDYSVKNGMYVYADMTSPNLKEGQKATLVGEILGPSSYSAHCLRFAYYLNGVGKATLSIGKMALDNTDKDMKYKTMTLFRISDKTGKGWAPAQMTIATPKEETYQLFFTATRGSGPQSIIALDDISLSDRECQRPTTEPPVIVTEMLQSPVSCDFDDSNFCSWEREKNELQFRISTPTRESNRKPKYDHTKEKYLGCYAYVRGDYASKKKAAISLSTVPKDWNGNFCFSFWYVMNVDGKNKLRVSAKHVFWSREDYVDYWSREGNYGYLWKHAYVHIKSSVQSPKIKITAEVTRGVISIDDLDASRGACPPSKMCTFDEDDDMCGYIQDTMNTLDWDIKSGEDNSTIKRMPDHSTQSLKGNYLYVGFNGGITTSQLSRVYGPKHSPAGGASCVTFYYHIYNVSNLSFNTYLATNNELSDPQWTTSISQGLLWHGARFSVAPKIIPWQVAFEVSVRSRGYGQVAIDDISVTDGKCPDPGYCDFESEDCLWENVREPFDEKNLEFQNAVSTDVIGDLLKANYDWIRLDADNGYGPSKDKTQGTPDGFYLFLSGMDTYSRKKAVYVSERLQASSGACLKMWYAMSGALNGANLQVLSSSDFLTARQEKHFRDSTDDRWTEALVTIMPGITSDYWIFLAGYSGVKNAGTIAIDDIVVKDGVCEDPKILTSTAEVPTETVISREYCDEGYKLCNDREKCIPGLLLCDGVKDCEDGSDETYGCNKASLCYEGFYFCSDRTVPRCINREKVCDGIDDCSDGSDESLCDNCTDTFCLNDGNCSVHDRTLICMCERTFYHNRCNKRPTWWTTLNPKILTPTTLSTKEVSTETVSPQRHCEKGYKLCNDGEQCIPGLLLCDGVKDCDDGSDETYGCNKASLCSEGFYFCSDRAFPPCIHREKVCDGFDDCRDGSDESLCDKCINMFCQNGGYCSVQDRKPVCMCESSFYHNRCNKRTISPEPEYGLKTLTRNGWIFGIAIAAILLAVITFIICYRRRTNA